MQPRRVLDGGLEGAADLHGVKEVVQREVAENLLTELGDIDDLVDRSRFAAAFVGDGEV